MRIRLKHLLNVQWHVLKQTERREVEKQDTKLAFSKEKCKMIFLQFQFHK